MKVKNISDKTLRLHDYSKKSVVVCMPGDILEGEFGNYPELEIIKNKKENKEEKENAG